MKRILFLCQNYPFPPDSGAKIRSFHLLQILAREFEVTVLSFSGKSDLISETGDVIESAVQSPSDIRVFRIPQQFSRTRLIWDHIRSVLMGRVYTVFRYESKAVSLSLQGLVKTGGFDLVHVDSLDLSGYLPQVRGIPVVCGHHNVESHLLLRRAEGEESGIRRLYLQLQSRLMEKEERRWVGLAASNITCSAEDARLLHEMVPTARVVVVPNGVDTNALFPSPLDGQGIVFLGAHDWFPNRDGMLFFAEQILPRIRDRHPESEVIWVGRAPEDVRATFEERFGIHMVGHVEDIRTYTDRAACMIVPLRVGGGTRLKILDGWALGRPIVSTSLGSEGLDAEDGKNILIRDDPQGFADCVSQLLEDAGLRAKIGSSGRETAVGRYDWSVIGEVLLTEYRHILGGSHPQSRRDATRD